MTAVEFIRLLRKQLIKHTPFPNFQWEICTLKDDADKSIRDRVIEFWHDHYSANLMTLVILSPLDLDEAEALIQTYFSPIQDHNYTVNAQNIPYVTQDQNNVFLSIEPLKMSES